MIVLDASVLIAWLGRGDAHSAEARAILRDRVDERLVAHRITIAESLVGPARTHRAAEAASAFDALGLGRLDQPDDPLELAVLRARTGLRIPDACVLLATRRDRATLATFDRRLAAAARGEGLRVLGVG